MSDVNRLSSVYTYISDDKLLELFDSCELCVSSLDGSIG